MHPETPTDKPAIEKIEAGDPETQSADLVADNIARLTALFPELVTEGKDGASVNVDVLKQLVGNATVTDCDEKFGLNWHGKRRARQLALTPSTGTLRPCPEESVDWDTTQNLFIEGDNLEVLKLLQKSYASKVKLIYIDPPYNTEGDFIYPDRYQDNLDTYLRYTGQINDEGFKVTTATETSGRKHTTWLNMMLPRLKASRQLLRHDGIIAVHIDEHEVNGITWLMDEIYGEDNRLGPIVWDKRNPKGDATKIASQHEYLVVYAKRLDALRESHALKRPKANAERMLAKAASLYDKLNRRQVPDDLAAVTKKYDLPVDVDGYATTYNLDSITREFQEWIAKQDLSGGEAAYKLIDSDGQVYRPVSMAWPNKAQAPDEYFVPLKHPITGKDCPVPERGWRNPPDTMKRLLDAGRILFGDDESTQPQRKYILAENMTENVPSIMPFGGSDDALLKRLKIPFDNPKPVDLAMAILQWFLGDEGVVMDFFAGSGTTAHACMKLNTLSGTRHRFILVQLPERLDPGKAEQKVGHTFCTNAGLSPTIAEIAKERVRRTKALIKSDVPETAADLGFRVFKLSSSNVREWQPNRDDIAASLGEHVVNLRADRTEHDVLYELLLRRGLDLCVPTETKEIAGKVVHAVGAGTLIACLAESITEAEGEALALGIVAWFKELDPAGDTVVVFRDGAFENDIVKTNVAAILAQNGLQNARSL